MGGLKVRPIVVVVPGSFTTEVLYTILIDKLKAQHYEVIFISLPTTMRGPGKIPTMYDDAAYIHGICQNLADDGKEIVLTMHSYGGFPGNQSASGLGKKEREAAGKVGGVVQLVYYSAIIGSRGQSTNMAMGIEVPCPENVKSIPVCNFKMSDGVKIFRHPTLCIYNTVLT